MMNIFSTGSQQTVVLFSTTLLLFVLSGCEGGSGSSRSNNVVVVPVSSDSTDGTDGTLTLLLTDAAVDTAIEVWVEFAGVELKPQGDESFSIEFEEPVKFDLLQLSGDNTAALLQDEVVPAGGYNFIRLDVNADEDGIFDSFVITELGEMIELEVTSQNGLQLVSGFTVTAGGGVSFVIDWDLRKGLTMPQGANKNSWKLRPALRITDLSAVGEVSGTVSDDLVSHESCTNDLAEDTGNGVYLYDGLDATPEDIHTEDTDPISTAPVEQDENGLYRYSMSFLSAGEYTISFTCQTLDDEADVDDEILFAESANITIVENEETTHDFGAESANP